jgi:hypothetical protein
MNEPNKLTRRQVLVAGAATAASMIIARSATASDMPALAVDDPTAQALGYVEDHNEVDTAKWPKKAGPDGANQKCTTCSLYQKIDDEWGGCPIFAGKKVKGEGWCNSWVAA